MYDILRPMAAITKPVYIYITKKEKIFIWRHTKYAKIMYYFRYRRRPF